MWGPGPSIRVDTDRDYKAKHRLCPSDLKTALGQSISGVSERRPGIGRHS